MYLIPIVVPIFTDGPQLYLQTDWKRALGLLRDSLGGRYGDLLVVAPRVSVAGEQAKEQQLERVEPNSGIRLRTLYDADVRTRQFWRAEARPLRALMAEALADADVVHTGLDELFRPMMEIAFVMAVRRKIPTVFVQDTDTVIQMRDLAGDDPRQKAYAWIYGAAFERACRLSVARADLSLLKGSALMDRYARYAKRACEFHDTSYLSSEIVPRADVERRLDTLGADRPLRFVYCGRLVARKGLADSVRLIERARARGARVELDVLGAGPEEAALRQQIAAAGLNDAVRLLGSVPYGPELLARLAAYDALLFTPTAEDTPRMIFDGYAAGLPMLGADISYVEERARGENATVVLRRSDWPAAAERLVALDRDRRSLVPLTEAAMKAALHHAADVWYARRAGWIHEAVAAKRAETARGA